MPRRRFGLAALVLIHSLAALSCAATLKQPAEESPLSPEQLLLRRAEILRAEDLRIADGSLAASIEDRNPLLRAAAARAMGRIGDSSLRAPLEKALRDLEPEVRAEAAFALGLLGDRAALPALHKAAGDASPAVRVRVAAALGLLGDAASEGTILSLLGDPMPEVVAAACYALPLFNKPGFALDTLFALLDERAEEVGMAALRGLAWMAADPDLLTYNERQRARERLTGFIDSRQAEARSLAAIGLARPALSEEAGLLGKLAEKDPSSWVRFNAIRSLSFPGAPVEPFVSKALKDDNEQVVLAAVEGLGQMKGPDAVEALAEVVVNDSRLWLRELAIALTGQVSPSKAAAMSKGMSGCEEPELRAATARLLLGRKDEHSLGIAAKLLADEDIRVRAAAIPAMAGADMPLSEALGEMINDDDPLIRVAVADAAGLRLADGQMVPELRQEAIGIIRRLWKGSSGDEERAVRLAAMDAAARAGAEPEFRAFFEEDLRSSDRQVRLRASGYLRMLYGESAAIGSAPPLEEYVEILRWAERPRAAVITMERPGFLPGEFTIRLYTQAAPLASWQFSRLAEERFFDSQRIESVLPGLLVQTGDEGKGRYLAQREISPSAFDPGTVGLAPSAQGLADGHWLVSLFTQPLLGRDHTAFARVVQNFAGVVSLLLPGDRIVSVRVYEGDGSEELPQP